MLKKTLNKGEEAFNKGELALKRAIGLGQTPNVVPVTEPKLDGPSRVVEVGWHPVGGAAGKWFAEKTDLGKMITEKINKYPDPTQHWAVLIGDYAHQLWMDEEFDVIYTNAKIVREEWQTFEVGATTFNDDAIRRAGETVIATIRAERPAYNLITNNCQTYALQLLDAIKVGEKKEFGTTLAVYDRILGPGKVVDLFKPEDISGLAEGQDAGQVAAGQDAAGKIAGGQDSVHIAQDVMNQNTAQLDPEEGMKKRKEKKSFFSRFKKS